MGGIFDTGIPVASTTAPITAAFNSLLGYASSVVSTFWGYIILAIIVMVVWRYARHLFRMH